MADHVVIGCNEQSGSGFIGFTAGDSERLAQRPAEELGRCSVLRGVARHQRSTAFKLAGHAAKPKRPGALWWDGQIPWETKFCTTFNKNTDGAIWQNTGNVDFLSTGMWH